MNVNALKKITNAVLCPKVEHLEPWEKGSRKTAGQVGMCGGVSVFLALLFYG